MAARLVPIFRANAETVTFFSFIADSSLCARINDKIMLVTVLLSRNRIKQMLKETEK
ncbi:MAG: hypothetical protein PHD76_03845 [Methylacidiphilales bacterium]|nr:hypothetical protein [Candidatus Methylacidiphilales bacterium]